MMMCPMTSYQVYCFRQVITCFKKLLFTKKCSNFEKNTCRVMCVYERDAFICDVCLFKLNYILKTGSDMKFEMEVVGVATGPSP